MGRATFLFHGALNDLLRADQRERELPYLFNGNPSLKHAIENFGVPHPEVGLPADLSAPLRDGDRVDVHPLEMRIGAGESWRFALDCHLGRLAKYLRILGFDTTYSNHAPDRELAAESQREGRVLLTMDRGLLMRSVVQRGYFVRSAEPRSQLLELMDRFALFDVVSPLSRCLRCNGVLQDVAKEAVLQQIPPRTRIWCESFRRCQACGQLYWAGSHHDRMLQWVDTLHSAWRTRRAT